MKTATNEDEKHYLQSEYEYHRIPEIASSNYIRSLHDTISASEDDKDTPSLVFEWMDMELRVLPAKRFRGDKKLFKTVAKGMLSGLAIFEKLKLLHGGMSLPALSDQFFLTA